MLTKKEREFGGPSLEKATVLHWSEVQVLLLCSGHSCVHCRFLGLQEQLLVLPVKDVVSIPASAGSPVAGHGDYVVGNKRCISIVVWEEAVC